VNTVLSVLQHALGRDEFGKNRYGRPDFRNHFCAGGDDLPICREAAAQGLMVEHAPSDISGGCPVFVVTDAGKAYIAEHSPPPPKVSRGKARYLRWLHVSDAAGETFGAWLKRETAGGGQ
jgi:hypothetical protein